MKIVKNIRDIYRDCAPRYQRLAADVGATLKSRVEKNGWFFLSRVKADESFALKIETGRVSDPENLEDFFACTIVVPTVSEIVPAERMVLDLYERKERRPARDDWTRKSSGSFVFDDLRLYVARKPSTSGKDPQLDGMVFEVQIKTVLQHAWSVATHDMIYKSDTVSWPLERIAFQVKAMLEHAEVSIANADQLAQATAVAKRDRRTAEVVRTIDYVRQHWSDDQLLPDTKRLATTILDLLRGCGLSVDKLPEVIRREIVRVKVVPTDLSPYSFTVQALAHSNSVDFERAVDQMQGDRRIVIHDDMDLPCWMRAAHPKILNLGGVGDQRG